MEKIQPTRTEIIEDVRIWSKHFLEVPNLHLGGVPACPFAKKAWLDKKVWVAVKTKNSTYKKELNRELDDEGRNWWMGDFRGQGSGKEHLTYGSDRPAQTREQVLANIKRSEEYKGKHSKE